MIYTSMTVAEVADLGPRMRRVTFTGEALSRFTTVAPDQQAKLFFARDGGIPDLPEPPADRAGVPGWYARYLAVPEPRRPWMRSYTVRRHVPDRHRVEIDFALHDGASGPASAWAARAAPGDVIGFYGPAESHFRPPPPGGTRLFAGDETALPAVAAWLETLGGDDRAVVHLEVADRADELELPTAAEVEVHWHHRSDGTDLLGAVWAAGEPADLRYGWLAGEASAVRALRRLLVGDWGMDKRAVSFTGYWRRHLTQDDAPTTEDAADAAETMADLEAAGRG